MSYSSSRDNWERLVAAVVKREQIWQLCHQDSITTIASSYSNGTLSLSSNSGILVSSPSPPLPLINDSIIEDTKNGSKTITHKLFSALRWKRKPKDYHPGQDLVGIPEYDGLENFSLRELLVATDKFSNKNVIGRGRHGTVYKGRLADESIVAVKRLQKQAIGIELELATHVTHGNVVKLLRFCITQEEQLLVYPYMQNGSVASCLRERPETQPPLGWPVRKTIALGVAKGLAYLHHECIRGIIHRDVKAANILLDKNFQAVVADFSVAQFMDCDDSVIKGTVGHIAPEYYDTRNSSEKTDVFGYGAFLLELITRQRALELARQADDEGMVLLDWVNNLFEKRMYEALVDSNLQWAFAEEEVDEMLQMALICMQKDPKGRPTMLEVVRMLEDGDGLPERWDESLMNNLVSEPSSSEVHENLEWIITDSSPIGAEELSGPR